MCYTSCVSIALNNCTNENAYYFFYMHVYIDGTYLPFIELSNASVALPSTLDSQSNTITISSVFSFGSTNATSLSVNYYRMCERKLIVL